MKNGIPQGSTNGPIFCKSEKIDYLLLKFLQYPDDGLLHEMVFYTLVIVANVVKNLMKSKIVLMLPTYGDCINDYFIRTRNSLVQSNILK